MGGNRLSCSIRSMVTGGIVACATGCAHGGPQPRELGRLVDAERAFCRAAAETSVRAAFLQYLSDDAIMLLPRPANGKQAYAARPESASELSWRPSCAAIAASGDLGYTFGPWEFRQRRGQEAADAYGHFLSVWRRQPDGRWLVVFDSGISHECPTGPGAAADIELRPAPGGGTYRELGDRERRELADRLLALDRSLGDTAAAADASGRLLAVLDDRATLFEESRFPVAGKDAVAAALRQGPAAIDWRPQYAAVAAAGDLGYVYGTAAVPRDGAPDGELSYIRIWARAGDGRWTVVVQKTNPAR